MLGYTQADDEKFCVKKKPLIYFYLQNEHLNFFFKQTLTLKWTS